MKTTINTRKALLSMIAGFGFSLLLVSCSKDKGDELPPGVHYATFGDASGAAVTPPVATTGTASMTGTYHTGTNKWEYSISWTNLSGAAIAIEIHGPAIAGQNGDLVFTETIENGNPNGAKSVSVTLSESQEENLLASTYYYTITTPNFPSGEVRGQVLPITR